MRLMNVIVFRRIGLLTFKVRLIILLFLFLSWSPIADAQLGKGVGFTLSNHSGGIIKHTEKLTFTPPAFISGLEAMATFRTHGRKDWEAWRNYPILGLSAHWFNLGTDQLGHSFGFFPFVDIPLIRRPQWQLFFQVGTGLAWLSRRYDRIHNPLQNAIGSKVNNVSAFRVHLDYNLNTQWLLTGGFSFTHYSNGQAQIPNFGINVVGGLLGVQWTPHPLASEDYREAGSLKKALRKWGISAHTGLAFKEYFAVGGPQYPIYMGSLAGLYQLSRVNRLYLGVEYEFNQGVYTFSKLSWQHNSDNDRFWASSRVMAFLGEEFLFGDWALLLQAGTYLGNVGLLIPKPVYTKLAIRYYLPPLQKHRARFFSGVYMKSHMITAEYISFGVGMTWD